ncbi:DUF1850 domain-containing protein [Pseudoruegeria sp. SK021]|uniref:DUF1850 domain-containing protein n=1 Tax=Pseudoruegeria sp. SK021 TaxID=1933035 RepID=UPI000A2580A0|nr:DUF1850 domain-containing protein [Pseudoruegeria sp. SK021]OSP55831.1 hypothetical protein BV911_05510 [Pseudoruegeria sp. SK021]
MSACLAVGAVVLQLAAGGFTLHWTHSVERVVWEEDWRVTPTALTLLRSRIKGSGAGMEPGPDAIWQDGWWVSPGHLSVPALTLAASGATGQGWTLCADGVCRDIGTDAGKPITLAPAPCDMAPVHRDEIMQN